MVLGKLIQAAEVTAADHVLDVACGTGYSSAILARIAASVVALEDDADLARRAEETLRSLGSSATAVCGPLEQGWVSRAPYDAIVVNGVVETVPAMLFEQLKEGGRLVAVVGQGPVGEGTVYRKVHGIVSGRPIFDAAAPILPNFVTPPSFVF
jgi:protein-L-isoaspartate(D-aspartate) O-methyltransferase